MSDTAPPGWYPDGSGTQRYWDGGRWLDAPPAGPPGPAGPRSWSDGGYGGGYGGVPPGPPGPPPGQKRSRAGLYAVLGVVAVVLVAALVTTLVLVTGGDDTDEQAGDGTSQSSGADPGDGASTDEPEDDEPADDRPDPADTVEAFVDAALDNDCDALEDLVTDEFLDDSGGCDPTDDDPDNDGVELTVGDTEVDGDTATVVLESSFQGETSESTLELVYEDDAWLVDGFELADAPSASASASAPTLPSPS